MAVARAFVNRPLILLADEPTGNLDPATSQGIMRLLDRINRTGTTVVMATHDAGIVDQMRRRVIELDHGTLVRDQARGVYGMARDGGVTGRRSGSRTNRRTALTMPVSLDYVARETASNLWRNRLMTVAAVLTVAVSLSLVGTARCCLRQGVAHATTQWQHGVERHRVAEAAASPIAERSSVRQQLHQLPYVQGVHVPLPGLRLQRGQAPADAGRVPGPDRGHHAVVVPVRRSTIPTQAQAIARQFHGYPGVKSVASPNQPIHNMETVSRILQLVFLVLAVILLLSASVLILNTIRLAIFARRREVSVMKLVGATNWFIRVPFMFEGVVQGLLGAVVAAVVVVVLHLVLDALGNGQISNLWYQMRLPTHEVVITSLVVLLIGVLIGSIGSAFGIRRFLDA